MDFRPNLLPSSMSAPNFWQIKKAHQLMMGFVVTRYDVDTHNEYAVSPNTFYYSS